jgi:hypothetical protein
VAAGSSLHFLVLHGLRVKGFATAEALAEAAGLEPGPVREELRRLASDGRVAHREGRLSGWALTATGRRHHQRQAADELDAAGVRAEVDDCYRRFLACNAELLAVCTAWQIVDGESGRQVNDHRDAAYDEAVVGRLLAVHAQVAPICRDLAGLLARFARYGPRLAAAAERVAAGDHDWFTKPTIASYHTVWFELHEDLLATLGLERSSEGQVSA